MKALVKCILSCEVSTDVLITGIFCSAGYQPSTVISLCPHSAFYLLGVGVHHKVH